MRRKGFAEEEAIETLLGTEGRHGVFGRKGFAEEEAIETLEPIWSARYRYWVGKDSLRKKRLRQSYLKMT